MGTASQDVLRVTELLSYQFVKNLVDTVKSEATDAPARRDSLRVPFRGKVWAVPVVLSDKRPDAAIVWLKDASRSGFCIGMKKQLLAHCIVLVGFRESDEQQRARWFRCVVRNVRAERDAYLIGLKVLGDFSSETAAAAMKGDVDAMLAVCSLPAPVSVNDELVPHA